MPRVKWKSIPESSGKSELEFRASSAYSHTLCYSVWSYRTGSICWESGRQEMILTNMLSAVLIWDTPRSPKLIARVLLKNGAVHELPATGHEEIRPQTDRKHLESRMTT